MLEVPRPYCRINLFAKGERQVSLTSAFLGVPAARLATLTGSQVWSQALREQMAQRGHDGPLTSECILHFGPLGTSLGRYRLDGDAWQAQDGQADGEAAYGHAVIPLNAPEWWDLDGFLTPHSKLVGDADALLSATDWADTITASCDVEFAWLNLEDGSVRVLENRIQPAEPSCWDETSVLKSGHRWRPVPDHLVSLVVPGEVPDGCVVECCLDCTTLQLARMSQCSVSEAWREYRDSETIHRWRGHLDAWSGEPAERLDVRYEAVSESAVVEVCQSFYRGLTETLDTLQGMVSPDEQADFFRAVVEVPTPSGIHDLIVARGDWNDADHQAVVKPVLERVNPYVVGTDAAAVGLMEHSVGPVNAHACLGAMKSKIKRDMTRLHSLLDVHVDRDALVADKFGEVVLYDLRSGEAVRVQPGKLLDAPVEPEPESAHSYFAGSSG